MQKKRNVVRRGGKGCEMIENKGAKDHLGVALEALANTTGNTKQTCRTKMLSGWTRFDLFLQLNVPGRSRWIG